jgi:hypothetical protein
LGNHAEAQCGMEVVLPNGELLRTGMGAMEGSELFALYKGYVTSAQCWIVLWLNGVVVLVPAWMDSSSSLI